MASPALHNYGLLPRSLGEQNKVRSRLQVIAGSMLDIHSENWTKLKSALTLKNPPALLNSRLLELTAHVTPICAQEQSNSLFWPSRCFFTTGHLGKWLWFFMQFLPCWNSSLTRGWRITCGMAWRKKKGLHWITAPWTQQKVFKWMKIIPRLFYNIITFTVRALLKLLCLYKLYIL